MGGPCTSTVARPPGPRVAHRPLADPPEDLRTYRVRDALELVSTHGGASIEGSAIAKAPIAPLAGPVASIGPYASVNFLPSAPTEIGTPMSRSPTCQAVPYSHKVGMARLAQHRYEDPQVRAGNWTASDLLTQLSVRQPLPVLCVHLGADTATGARPAAPAR